MRMRDAKSSGSGGDSREEYSRREMTSDGCSCCDDEGRGSEVLRPVTIESRRWMDGTEARSACDSAPSRNNETSESKEGANRLMTSSNRAHRSSLLSADLHVLAMAVLASLVGCQRRELLSGER
jgi:hypothetical protein